MSVNSPLPPSATLTTSPMLALPAEIVVRVSFHLRTNEFCSFRQSCRYIETALFDTFAREFFSKRQFMLEEHSLQALLDISKHATLAGYLNYVIVAGERLNGSRAHKFRDQNHKVDPIIFLWSGQARTMLAEAFKNLPNLRTVGLRDYSGAERLRDGSRARWRSYGWAADHDDFMRQRVSAGQWRVNLTFPGASASFFPVLLAALADADASPKALEVIIRHHLKLNPKSFGILNTHMASLVQPVLLGLKSLFLPVTFSPGDAPPERWGSEFQLPLRRFIRSLENVESLRLNFMEDEAIETVQFLEWFGDPSLVANLPSVPPPMLTYLNTLELGMCTTTPASLLCAITRFNLRKLSLWKVCIADILLDLHYETTCWDAFLRNLAASVSPELGSILIGNPSQERNDPHLLGRKIRTRVSFGTLNSVEFSARSGGSVKDWLLQHSELANAPGDEEWNSSDRESYEEDDDQSLESDLASLSELASVSGEDEDYSRENPSDDVTGS